MNTRVIFTPSWSTASFGDPADSVAIEWAALGVHLYLCQGQHGRLFELRCVAQSLHRFVAAHFVTTLVLVTSLIEVGSLIS